MAFFQHSIGFNNASISPPVSPPGLAGDHCRGLLDRPSSAGAEACASSSWASWLATRTLVGVVHFALADRG